MKHFFGDGSGEGLETELPLQSLSKLSPAGSSLGPNNGYWEGQRVFLIGSSHNFNNRYWEKPRHVLGHDEVGMREIVPRKMCLDLPTEHVHSFSAQSQHLCEAVFWRRIWRGPRDGAPSPTPLQAVSSCVESWSQ